MKIFTLELNFDIAWKNNHGCCEHLQTQHGRLALHGGRDGPGSGTSSALVFLGQAPSMGPSLVLSLTVLYFSFFYQHSQCTDHCPMELNDNREEGSWCH